MLPDRVWLIPVILATAATCVTARPLVLVVPLLAVALLPWLLLADGRSVSTWLFGVVGIAPVVGILLVDGLSASVFLGTTALCLLASRADRAWPVALLTVVGIALPFAGFGSGGQYDLGSVYFGIGDLFGIIVGVLLGRTRRLDAQLREADARLVAVAAQEERTQLARDVHDLVAHSLTVVVLHVGGARRVLRADPARAEAALEQAEHVCRESLDGIREVVGLLRAGDDAPRAAVDLLRLTETYRAAGVAVDLNVHDATSGLSLLVRGTLYRVVQEALANAARYRSPGSTVRVSTAVQPDGVTVTVSNAGSSGPRSEAAGGYGLTGLREQVTALGGTLRSGPTENGWIVECRLPQDATAVRSEQRSAR